MFLLTYEGTDVTNRRLKNGQHSTSSLDHVGASLLKICTMHVKG